MTMQRAMMASNPWEDIEPSGDARELKGRRADPGHPFDFFRCRDARGRALFLLEVAGSSDEWSLPDLRGLEIIEQALPAAHKRQLLVLLRDETNIDLFHRLCLDLLDATRTSESERAAVAVTIGRLVRWQQLLKMGRREKLSDSEQKGLIGELLFLRDTVFPIFGAADSLAFWVGAVEAEGRKDFSIGTQAVEVKARSGTAPSRIQVSSDDQLDDTGYRRLFLAVYELGVASSRADGSFSLSDLVEDVRKIVSAQAPAATGLFEQRLEARGYSDTHDYQDDRRVCLGSAFYQVRNGFPRVTRSDVPAGVLGITYQLDLAACADYRVTGGELSAALGEEV